MIIFRWLKPTVSLALLVLLGIACTVSTHSTVSPAQTRAPAAAITDNQGHRAEELSQAEIATLSSLTQVDDYPLYTMHYQGAYWAANSRIPLDPGATDADGWACSLFAALADADQALYGRNFDWQYSPALLLFTNPPDGFASVSMVDIAYLGFDGERAHAITDLPLEARRSLLEAPFWPFDGMNAQGVVVGMAAVPASLPPHDPDKPMIGSLRVMREILDRARDVDEAFEILRSFNVSWSGGPPLHYLIADRAGQAILVEYYQGKLVTIPSEGGWHVATNFLQSATGASAQGHCRRYDRIDQRLSGTLGRITVEDALSLLADVAQENTQWSIVYHIGNSDVHVAMGRRYLQTHTFHLNSAKE